MILRISLITIVALTLNACSNNQAKPAREGIDPKPEVQAQQEVTASFVVLNENNESLLGIRRSALDKELLLSASLISQTKSPTSSGLQSRVIALRQIGKSVFILEATQGHVVTRELPANLILAELPVLREEGDTLVVDFNAGMSKIFTTSNWHSSPDAGGDYNDGANFTTLPVKNSFLESIVLDKNRLAIRQIAQMDYPQSGQSFEARYFLEPYMPNPAFEPRETTDFTQIGYFEVGAKLEAESGRPIVRISRWDDTQPITYSVSASTPVEYQQAVREGILYWNKVFGREVLRADIAPKGITAPDINYNIIQWVPWDYAGSAYADALIDPRSGEILHSQVYLTSVFAFGAKRRAMALLRRLSEPTPSAQRSVGLKLFSSSSLCQFGEEDLSSARAQIAGMIEQLQKQGADDATYLRVAQDYVRFVTAHEVGHTLGLRHNFAGSLAANVSLTERDRQFNDYVLTNKIPSTEAVTVSSSVMDYLVFQDDIIGGAQMTQAASPGWAYDRRAIAWGYQGQEPGSEIHPLFCTDGQVPLFADCQRFDAGSKPIAFQSYTTAQFFKSIPVTLVETFIAAKTAPDAKDRKPFERVTLNPAGSVGLLVDAYAKELLWLRDSTRSLRIERQFPSTGPLYQDKIRQSRFDQVTAEITELGGITQLLFGLMQSISDPSRSIVPPAMAELDAYLARPAVRQGVGLDGKPYVLTDAEVAFIRQESEKYFIQLETLITPAFVDTLAASRFEEPATATEIETTLGSLAEYLITQPSTSKDLRMKALGLLKPSLGKALDWSLEARGRILSQIVTEVEAATGKKFAEIKELDLPKNQREWFMERKALVITLSRM